MLLEQEQSATSIQDDHLVIHGDSPHHVQDANVFGVTLHADDSVAESELRYGLEISFHQRGQEIQTISIDQQEFDSSTLVAYAERVAAQATKNILHVVARQPTLQINGTTFRESGVSFVADGTPLTIEYAEVTAVDSVGRDTLLWREQDLEPFAVIRLTDPSALVLRELFRRAVPSTTQQTDWIAADQDFFQMVGPIECHERSLVPSFAALRAGTIAFGCALAALAWWAIPQYAIYVSGIIAVALTVGTVVLNNQANQSGTILAVFRRGVTLFGTGEQDVSISWLDITDAKLESCPNASTGQSVTLELHTSAEIGKVIRLAWDGNASDQRPLDYLHQQLQRRIWKHAERKS